MLLTQTLSIPPDDVTAFAWNNLRRFLNVEFVAQRIIALHSLPQQQHENARKQARQIRYCLMQAREYADAAAAVSSVTKPVLLYYSTMCLALAELLLKGNGTVSLDFARAQHAHHGLEFHRAALAPEPLMPLTTSAKALTATPRLKDGKGRGTFALWHETSRHAPLTGNLVVNNADYTSTASHAVLFTGDDVAPPSLPAAGLTLLDVMARLPAMGEHVALLNIVPQFIRATASAQVTKHPTKGVTHRRVIQTHPMPDAMIDAFAAACSVAEGAQEHVKLIRKERSFIIMVTTDDNAPPVKMSIPYGAMWREDEARIFLADEPLTEFGLYYLGLFIASNYARYYPDQWVAEVEQNSFLALAISEMVQTAQHRVPLLCLSELARVYYVIKRR